MDYSFRIFFRRSDKNSIVLMSNSPTGHDPLFSTFVLPYTENELKTSLTALELLNRPTRSSSDSDILEKAFLLHSLDPKKISSSPSCLIEHIGHKLYQVLFIGEIGEKFQEVYTQVKNEKGAWLNLHLQFDVGSRELLKYPWQLLRDAVIAPLLVYSNVNITYELSNKNDPPSFSFPKRPISLMAISPRPEDITPSLPNDTIAESINSDRTEQFFQIIHCPPQYDEFLQAIEEKKPEIVHFYGHGKFGKSCPECKRQDVISIANWWEDSCREEKCGHDLHDELETGFLIFEDKHKKSAYISRNELHKALAGRHVKLFILSACQTAASSRGDDDVAGILLQCNIPAILAMQFSVDAHQANLFNTQFYQRLIQELQQNASFTLETIGQAISSSRRFLEDDEGFRPILITHARQGEGEVELLSNPVIANDLLENIQKYKYNLANQIAQDAASQQTSLDLQDYIANYIPLTVTHDWGDFVLGKKQKPENSLEKLRRSRGKLILLQGSIGSGKSALAKHLAYTIAKDKTASVPILIELRHSTNGSLTKQIVWQLTHYNQSWLQNGTEDLDDLLTKGDVHGYFIFDGLSKASSDIIKDIEEFWHKYHTHTVVIMSRPSRDLISKFLHTDQVERLRLQPLTAPLIREHMQNHDLQIKMIKSANTPMILSFLLNGVEKAKVNNHGQIFKDYVDRVLETEDSKQIGQNIPEQVKWDVLKRLAYTLTYRHERNITYRHAVEVISVSVAVLNRRDQQEGENNEIKVEQVLESVIEHGFLQKEEKVATLPGEETLYFVPGLWMQEYFAAEKLKDMVAEESKQGAYIVPWKTWFRFLTRPELLNSTSPEKRWQLLFHNSDLAILAHDPWWTETFILVADLLEDSSQASWLLNKLARSWERPGLAIWCDKNTVITENEIIGFFKKLNSPDENIRYEAIKEVLDSLDLGYPSLSDKQLLLLVEATGDESPKVWHLVLDRLISLNPDKIRTDIENLGTRKSEKFQQGKERIFQALQNGLPTKAESDTANSPISLSFTFVGTLVLIFFLQSASYNDILETSYRPTIRLVKVNICFLICRCSS